MAQAGGFESRWAVDEFSGRVVGVVEGVRGDGVENFELADGVQPDLHFAAVLLTPAFDRDGELGVPQQHPGQWLEPLLAGLEDLHFSAEAGDLSRRGGTLADQSVSERAQ